MAAVTLTHRLPSWLRRVAAAIPARLQPQPKRVIRAQAYSSAGEMVHDIDLIHPDFHMVTGIREHDGRVWLGSLEEPAIAVVDL